jgi:hypothetical protein
MTTSTVPAEFAPFPTLATYVDAVKAAFRIGPRRLLRFVMSATFNVVRQLLTHALLWAVPLWLLGDVKVLGPIMWGYVGWHFMGVMVLATQKAALAEVINSQEYTRRCTLWDTFDSAFYTFPLWLPWTFLNGYAVAARSFDKYQALNAALQHTGRRRVGRFWPNVLLLIYSLVLQFGPSQILFAAASFAEQRWGFAVTDDAKLVAPLVWYAATSLHVSLVGAIISTQVFERSFQTFAAASSPETLVPPSPFAPR